MTWQRAVPAWRWAKVMTGDTLDAIAAREMGDASKWPEIASLNDLAHPFIVDALEDVGDRTRMAGQRIKIPVPSRQAAAITDPEDIFGTDLHLPGGLLRATEGGDLELVSGAPNLGQALRHKMETRTRELIRHPRYGNEMHSLKGGTPDATTNMLAAAYLDRCIRSDPRVVATEGTRARLQGDTIDATTTAVATDGKQLPVGGTD